jgi:two-component system sensor histidine kinase KdpD
VTTVPTKRGRLKIFLGYAAGVGKTYQMLTEARELKKQGVDVVVAYFEPHGRKDTMALVEGLELIPRRTIEYKGSLLEEMDTDAVLRRHPQMAVVDEFPHTNVPGSPRAKRWEDVRLLLDAGIDVLTTMNVQHVESLNDQIWQSTGVRVRETVPDWVVKQADEVVMVDLTPRALLNRLERGVVYPPDRARAALQNFFREPTLVALRELAMRQTAHSIGSRQHPEEATLATPAAQSSAEASERLLLVIEPDPASAALIRRGRRVADYLRADCLGVYVGATADLRHLSDDDRDRLQRHLGFAQALQIETHVLDGTDFAETLVTFARQQRVTQIFVLRQRERTLRSWLTEGLVQQIVNLAQDMQVTVVADRSIRKRST